MTALALRTLMMRKLLTQETVRADRQTRDIASSLTLSPPLCTHSLKGY